MPEPRDCARNADAGWTPSGLVRLLHGQPLNMRARRPSHRTWPFWLLIAAWLSANLPATVPLHTFVWAKGAEHFSHSADLRERVAELVTGVPRPAVAQRDEAHPGMPLPSPAVPVEMKPTKADLAPLAGPFHFFAGLSPANPPEVPSPLPASPWSEVPVPPPRAGIAG